MTYPTSPRTVAGLLLVVQAILGYPCRTNAGDTYTETATSSASTGEHPSASPPERAQLLANAQHYLPNRAQQEALIAELKAQEEHYDASVQLVILDIPPTANHYHTNLIDTTAHPFRQSASYAADLMDSGVPEYQQRAFRIFKQVIAHQDQQAEHDTYGIWPYHLEEPLVQMNKPDWNWADFIGVDLLETYMKHHDAMPEDLRSDMEAAIMHASHSIQKRDVKPGYTNIAIMGTLVTYLSAHLFDLPEMKAYADMRLRRFYDYTVELGGFAEYNSPTYTRIALDELCRMRQYILEPEAKKLINYCYKTGWEVLASHFHPPTAQLAAPHSRSYATLMRDDFYDQLYGASQGVVDYHQAQLPADYYKLQHELPQDFVPRFLQLTQPRVEIDTFSVGDNPVVGYTYLHPQYCLGTTNRSTTWQQRRPLVAYWGTVKRPRYLQPKLLHDHVEFAAGNIFSVQNQNRVLTTLNLATDGGDYHISIDRLPDGVFRASDLRLRFELGGAVAYDQVTLTPEGGIQVRDESVQLTIQLVQALFDGQIISRLEKGKGKEKVWVDLIIYNGPEKTFDLTKIKEASFGWTTHIYAKDEGTALAAPKAATKEDGVQLRWGDLSLFTPTKPTTEAVLQGSFSAK